MNSNSKNNKHSKKGNCSSTGAFQKGSRDIATAPYNFVSLTYNKEGNRDGSPIFTKSVDDSKSEAYSGTITCTLKAVSPIMVAGPSDRNEKNEVRRFLEVDGNKIIPGSSIKGMFRSYLEAFSCSALTKVNNDHIEHKLRIKDNTKENSKVKYIKSPYPMTPSEMIGFYPSNDFCAQLFGYINEGNKEIKAKKGKISFSCCKLDNANELGIRKIILSSPKLTCVQHYVDQNISNSNIQQIYIESNTGSKADSLKGYSQGNHIRGRKFYWHRKIEEPRIDDNKTSKSQSSENTDIITSFVPIDKGAEGTFRINLFSVNETELGGLLELLNVPAKSAFKIGMAKPYGFGSIQILINKIEIEKDSSRYSNLSSRLSNNKEEFTEETKNSLIKKFEEYVFKSVNNGKYNSYNELQSIVDLREMMIFKEKSYNLLLDDEWRKLTSYMPSPTDKKAHPSFNDKKILPYPRHVKQFRSV